MGYLPSGYDLIDIEEIKGHLISYRGNNYIRNLITGHKEKFPSAIINLTEKNNQPGERKDFDL